MPACLGRIEKLDYFIECFLYITYFSMLRVLEIVNQLLLN